VVRAFLARAREVDRRLNCFIELDDGAVDIAAASTGRASTPEPLHCLPNAYKDVFAHRGVAPSVGARAVRLRVRAQIHRCSTAWSAPEPSRSGG
jgi:Asp-tRNA(Asn)/Glu-tRNA(Gln) amidotransferase A subunit family amidase